MTEQELTEFEAKITQTARGFVYPRMPALRRSTGVRTALQARLVLAVAAAVLVLGAALLTVPSVWAAVLRFLQIGVVKIEVPQSTPVAVTVFPTITPNPIVPTPTPTRTKPTATPKPLADQLDLFGKTTLTVARASGIRIKVPLALGPPDAVYLQDVGGNAAILVWFDAVQPGEAPKKVRVTLQVFTSDIFAQKSPPTVLRTTMVKGKAAAWVQGEHILKVKSGDFAVMQLVSANALVWTEDTCTYRLETDLTMSEALAIAETTP